MNRSSWWLVLATFDLGIFVAVIIFKVDLSWPFVAVITGLCTMASIGNALEAKDDE